MSTDYQAHIPPGMLMRVIDNKQDMIEHYGQLRKMTTDWQYIEIIQSIYEDEVNQLNLFINLYVHIFGEQPHVMDLGLPQIDSFASGINNLYLRELGTHEFYSNVASTDPNVQVSGVFLLAMEEESRHAKYLHYIYTRLTEAE